MILLIPILRIPLSPFLLVCILAAIYTAQVVVDLKQHPYHRQRRLEMIFACSHRFTRKTDSFRVSLNILKEVRSYSPSLFLYFRWPTLNYMPGFYHFSILNTVYTYASVINYFTTLQSLRGGYIWCQ
jgi:hypothetical protein